jgi:hypothetical protein
VKDAIVTELGVASFNRPDEMQQFEGRAANALHGYNITPRRLCAGDDLANAEVLKKALKGVTTMLEHNTSGSNTFGFDVQIYLNAANAPQGFIQNVHNTLRLMNCLVPAKVKVRAPVQYYIPIVHTSFCC